MPAPRPGAARCGESYPADPVAAGRRPARQCTAAARAHKDRAATPVGVGATVRGMTSEESLRNRYDVAGANRRVAARFDLGPLPVLGAIDLEIVVLGAVGETAGEGDRLVHRHAAHIGISTRLVHFAQDVER